MISPGLWRALSACLPAVLLASPALAEEAAGKRPNVLMIVVDDLKPALGCYGDKHALTPNLDTLASRGAILTSAHANQAVCAPSRCSLFSGLRPDRTKVHDLETDFHAESPWVTTLQRLFRDAGYSTLGCGKVFHGGASDPLMEREAFDRFVQDGDLPYNPDHPKPALHYQNAASQAAVQALPPEHRNRWGKVNQALKAAKANPSTECLDLPDDAYVDGALAKQAIAFLDEFAGKDKPFFITVGFKSPHLPFIAPKKYWDLYDPAKLPKAEFTKAPDGAPPFAMQNSAELRNYGDIPKEGTFAPELDEKLVHGYYASTSFADAQVGKVLDALKERGLDDNTIVVLWGDHGFHLGDHGMWCKHTNYEQATRTVLMFAGPGVSPGKSSAAPAELVDVYATVCDLSGVKPPDNLDSLSLKPVLTGASDTHRPFAQSQYPRWNGTMGYAFRDGRHRYVAWVDNKDPKSPPSTLPDIRAEELYDYEADPLETRNLAGDADQADRIAGFRKEASDFLARQAERIAKQPAAAAPPTP